MKACMVCLGLNVPLCLIGKSEAKYFLNEILVKHGFEKIQKNHYVCLLCKSSVMKAHNFIQKVLRAKIILKSIKDRDKTVTYLSLAAIDRSKLKLDISLSYENIYNIEILNNAHTDDEIEEDTLVKKEIIQVGLPSEPFDPLAVEDKNNLDKPKIIDEMVCNNYETKIEQPKESLKDLEHDSDLIDLDETIDDGDSSEIAKKVIDVTENECQLVKECFDENRDKELTDEDENVSLATLKKRKKNAVISGKGNKRKLLQPPKKKRTLIGQKKKIMNEPDEKDEDYKPDSSSESNSSDDDSDYELYNDNGRRLKKPDTRDYPMDCDDCDYEVQSKKDHFLHYLRYHRDKKYPYRSKQHFVCHVCGNIKTTQAHLEDHLLTHGERKFKCEICGKKFYNKPRLYNHKFSHSKNMICDYCSKPFADRVQLIRHIRTHTGEKPHPCHICGARFAHLGNVGVHIRSVHQNQPINKPNRKKLTEQNDKKKPKKHQAKQQKGKKKKKSKAQVKIYQESDEEDRVPLSSLK